MLQRIASVFSLLAYLDPGDDKGTGWSLLAVAGVVVVALVLIFALTRFVVWAARR